MSSSLFDDVSGLSFSIPLHISFRWLFVSLFLLHLSFYHHILLLLSGNSVHEEWERRRRGGEEARQVQLSSSNPDSLFLVFHLSFLLYLLTFLMMLLCCSYFIPFGSTFALLQHLLFLLPSISFKSGKRFFNLHPFEGWRNGADEKKWKGQLSILPFRSVLFLSPIVLQLGVNEIVHFFVLLDVYHLNGRKRKNKDGWASFSPRFHSKWKREDKQDVFQR